MNLENVDVLIAEFLSVGLAFLTNYLLAKKNRLGWVSYSVGGLFMVYMMVVKNAPVTVINQSMMVLLGIKNYFFFDKTASFFFKAADALALPVFLYSLTWVSGMDLKSLVEVFLWVAIIAKTAALGMGITNGWLVQIATQSVSVVFGLSQGLYLYAGRAFIQIFQGVYGYREWNKNSRP